MQLTGFRASVTRPCARRSAVSSPQLNALARPQQRRVVVTLRATETEEATTALEGALERAKTALEADEVDKDTLASAIADMEAEMASLRSTAANAEAKALTLEAAVATTKDQFVRLTADFENFRRRSKEESSQLADSVRSDVVKDLLPLIDNFELARTNVKAESEAEQKINNSYQALYKQMVDIIRALGVEPVPTTGTPFDPMVHDAIMREPSNEHPDGTVLKEFRKGFRLGDKLLRPAMVGVSFTEDAPVASSEE